MKRVLVAVITAIVVAIAEPVRLDADVGLFALEMIGWTSGIHGTALVSLITSDVVLTVVHTVTDLGLRYATLVGTGELAICARPVGAVLLVAAVLAVVLVVALPRLEDAAAVLATEFVGAARVVGCKSNTRNSLCDSVDELIILK